MPTLQGAPTYDSAKFCEKLYEIDKILGRTVGRAPLGIGSREILYKDDKHPDIRCSLLSFEIYLV